MKTTQLIGPFSKIYPLSSLALKGPLTDDQLSPINAGGLLIEGHQIVALGKFSELATQADSIVKIESPLICIPGLIDCHTHLLFGGNRSLEFSQRNAGQSYLEIDAAGGGIWSSVQQTRALSIDQMTTIVQQRANECLRSGITTVEIKSGYGLSTSAEIGMLTAIKKAQAQLPIDIVTTCLAAHAKPVDWQGSAHRYLESIIAEIFPILLQKRLSHRIDLFMDHHHFSPDDIHKYLQTAHTLGFDICLHAEQFRRGGVTLGIEHKAVSVDHLEVIEQDQIQHLASTATVAVVLPGACLGLGQTFAPARQLLDAGNCLAIASDYNPGSAPYGDLILQAALLGTFEKLSIAELIAGITFRAAAALNLRDRGVLAPNKKADFCAFQANDIHEIFYAPRPLRPHSVWKNGSEINL